MFVSYFRRTGERYWVLIGVLILLDIVRCFEFVRSITRAATPKSRTLPTNSARFTFVLLVGAARLEGRGEIDICIVIRIRGLRVPLLHSPVQARPKSRGKEENVKNTGFFSLLVSLEIGNNLCASPTL